MLGNNRMTQKFGRVLISDKHNQERLSISNKEDYQIQKDLRQGYFYEIVGLSEYQVKPYFDLDPRGEFDYSIFDEFEAAKNKKPTPEEQKDTSAAELNQARTQQIMAQIEGVDADSQLNYMSMAMAEKPGRPQDYGH